MIDRQELRRVVRTALDEDLGAGDVTSRAVIDDTLQARGVIVAREPLVVSGMEVVHAVFGEIDVSVRIETSCADGTGCKAGARIATLRGPARSILAGERTALNFLQRMSGIATMTRRCVEAAGEAKVEIADTRKTAPGLRALDKHAVLTGGGFNHRAGLYDAILIKDNHWRLAGGIGAALARARRSAGQGGGAMGSIEIEVGTVDEVREALDGGADALLLDNMDAATLEQALQIARGRAFLEVSGGIREGDVARLASLGLNRISIGALTHSARAADIALEIEPL